MKECFRNPYVLILLACQSLAMSNAVIMISSGGTIGLTLSQTARWSTLPITFYVFGSFLMMFPASYLCGMFGRQRAFLCGALLGILGGLLFYFGVSERALWLVCLGTACVGMQRAFMEYYRFAVAELVSAQSKAFAMSLIVGGGLVSALLGPWIAQGSRRVSFGGFFTEDFSATALSIGALCLLQFLLLCFYHQPQSPAQAQEQESQNRFRGKIDYRYYIFIAMMITGAGAGLMVLMMNAAPVSMQHEFHLSFEEAVSAIRWHVIGMFLPSFFTGYLIKRYGVLMIASLGMCFLFLTMLTGMGAHTHGQFLLSLILLGIGWNFCFLSGSYLVVLATPLENKSVVQGVHDVGINALTLSGSFLAGVAVAFWGWSLLSLVGMVIICLLFIVLMLHHRLLRYRSIMPS